VAYDWKMILLLFVGGFLVTGSANAINQVVERDTDALMKRTASRPVAAGRMTVSEGWAFAVLQVVALHPDPITSMAECRPCVA
jgi:protoheme IX farnesyltransferase